MNSLLELPENLHECKVKTKKKHDQSENDCKTLKASGSWPEFIV